MVKVNLTAEQLLTTTRAVRKRLDFSRPVEMEVLALFPHMHLIGRDFRITAIPPAADPFSLI